MKILVTGATGFIGSAVCQQLTEHNVIMTSRSDPAVKTDKFLENDFEYDRFFILFRGVEVIVHTAARVHQMEETSKDPLVEFMEINCFGTLSWRASSGSWRKAFIFLSSTKVNGDKTEEGKIFRFNDVPMSQDPYGVSKSEAENGLFQIARDSNIEVVIIRPPLVYGPGVKLIFILY